MGHLHTGRLSGYRRGPSSGGRGLDAQGGYLCRLESFDQLDLVGLAREALTLDGVEPSGHAITVSAIPKRKVVRISFRGPGFEGREGARWYDEHRTFAELLSQSVKATVHTYVFDPDELEQVMAYGNGRWVGGERVKYDEVEVDGELDEVQFEQLKARWPLGHLAYVFGVTREELLRLGRQPTAVIPLDGAGGRDELARLFRLAAVGELVAPGAARRSGQSGSPRSGARAARRPRR